MRAFFLVLLVPKFLRVPHWESSRVIHLGIGKLLTYRLLMVTSLTTKSVLLGYDELNTCSRAVKHTCIILLSIIPN